MPDVKSRISMSKRRFGKLRHIWTDKQLDSLKPAYATAQSMRLQCHDIWIGGMAPDNRGDRGAERGKREHDERHHGEDTTRRNIKEDKDI